MKYGLLILILLILFISILYVKNSLSKFVCDCEKEDFYNIPPKFKTFDEYIALQKTSILPGIKKLIDPAISDPKTSKEEKKQAEEIKLLINTLLDTQDLAKPDTTKPVTNKKESFANPEDDKPPACAATCKFKNIVSPTCDELSACTPCQDPKADGYAAYVKGIEILGCNEYKNMVALFKLFEKISPTENLKIKEITDDNITDEEYCKFWKFFTDVGVRINSLDDVKKCTKSDNKTFQTGQTSSFNFTDKNLENKVGNIPESNIPESNIASMPSPINKYILKTEIPAYPDMTKYVKKSELKKCEIDKSKYILKSKVPVPSRVPDPNKYILKTQLTPPPRLKGSIYKDYNIAGGPLDMTMDYGLYPMKTRFHTCSYAKVGTNEHIKLPSKDDNNNEYNSNRLSQCKSLKNIKTPDIFGD